MTCASCVRRVEKALAKADGVLEARVNLATEKATVEIDPAVASPAGVRDAIERAGYTAGEAIVREWPAAASARPGHARGACLPIPLPRRLRRLAPRRTVPPPGRGVAADRGDDVRLVRAAGRAGAGQGTRRDGRQRQPGDRKASVAYDPAQVDLGQLTAAVEKAGYKVGAAPAPAARVTATTGTPSASAAEPADERARERDREIADLKRKSLVSLAVGVVMMALMYVPLPVSMGDLAPLLLIAATVVQFWAGGIFYKAAWAAARHGGTNMNTLVAVGTSAAYGYSAFVTLWPGLSARWGFEYHLYYESAVIVIALILMGRWLEARAKRRPARRSRR
jgi:Cu+-exporting ATPase